MRVSLIDPSNFTLPYDYALSDGLVKNGCEVSLIKRGNRPGEQECLGDVESVEHYYLYSEANANTLKKFRLYKAFKVIEHLVNQKQLSECLQQLGPDVVHFQWLVVPWLDRSILAAIFRDYCTVLTVHDSQLYHGSPSGLVQARGWIDAIRCFDHVIVHTRFSHRVLCEAGIPERALTLIPHGALTLDGTSSRVAKPVVDGPKEDTSLKMLLFGYLKKYKGLDTLAEALSLIGENSLSRIHLVIAGKPHNEVMPVIRDLENILPAKALELDLRFLPEYELADRIATADVVLFPYHRIDASGAFMATIPFGKIVIASRAGVFAEYLDSGKNGPLFDPGDSAELSALLRALINDMSVREKFSEAACRLAADIPSWEEIGRRTVALYDRAIRDRQ